MGFNFLLYTTWASLFLGPILILISCWLFFKRKKNLGIKVILIGIVLTCYGLYFWIPEIVKGKERAELRQQQLKENSEKPGE